MTSRNKVHKSHPDFYISLSWAIFLFLVSIAINSAANNYATITGKYAVTDLVLSNTPVFNVGPIVIYGAVFLIILIVGIFMTRPAVIPFTLKSLALFLITRAVFMSLTHLGQFTPQALLDSGAILDFIGGGNTGGLFFSGHTGSPFLLSLVFWDNKNLRTTFLVTSIILGASMLLGHLHYSIDVLGAFFITYTIYHLACKFFPGDYQLLAKGLKD